MVVLRMTASTTNSPATLLPVGGAQVSVMVARGNSTTTGLLETWLTSAASGRRKHMTCMRSARQGVSLDLHRRLADFGYGRAELVSRALCALCQRATHLVQPDVARGEPRSQGLGGPSLRHCEACPILATYGRIKGYVPTPHKATPKMTHQIRSSPLRLLNMGTRQCHDTWGAWEQGAPRSCR